VNAVVGGRMGARAVGTKTSVVTVSEYSSTPIFTADLILRMSFSEAYSESKGPAHCYPVQSDV
jgi:hypothetical protein